MTEINNNSLQKIESLLKAGKINKALRQIQWAVLQVTSDDRYTAVKFDSPELDLQCEKIGKCVAKKILGASSPTFNSSKHTIVIVCSRLQTSGGHTRVIEDFIRQFPNKDTLLLVTEVPGRSDRKLLGERISALGATVEWSGRGNLEKRLVWLQRRLLAADPDDVYLFNHHEDGVAVSAMQILSEAKIHFYHHGDHHLCLGLHIRGAEHIDIHAFGYNNCKNNLGINLNTYMPLVAEDRGPRPQSLGFISGGKLISCTAAGKNKVEIRHAGVSYTDVIPKLLSSTKGRHIHIGKLSWLARFRIRRSLQRAGLDLNSFVYIPWVQSVWDALHQYNVDLYLSSFPVTGGRTLIEAMGSGTPVVLYNNQKSRLLSGVDLVYSTAFIWNEVSDLLNYIPNITPEKLVIESKVARDYFLSHYHDELLKVRLNEQISHAPPPLNPLVSVNPGSIDSSLSTHNNTATRSFIRTSLYLRLKYLRSVLHNLVFS